MRHGAEPWEELAVKLMLKWPGLYYMTSAFAPKYYPKAIVDYANTRGADKIMYAGYYPMGLILERIFTEMPDVPFRDHVWPKFLRENAIEVFKIERHGSRQGRMSDAAASRPVTGTSSSRPTAMPAGSIEQYREYLDPRHRDEFDAWRDRYKNPFRDLHGKRRNQNWDDERRISASSRPTASSARCIFPNTVPPFFPTGALIARPPSASDFERAPSPASAPTTGGWSIGAPSPRSGAPASGRSSSTTSTRPSQDVRSSRSTACAAASCSPAVPTTRSCAPLYDPVYEPLWSACEDLDVTVNHHSGSGSPELRQVLGRECCCGWSRRRGTRTGPLWHLIVGGVFERHPRPEVRR